MKFKIKIIAKKILADTITPVSIYLKLRDKFPNSILLESSDHRGSEGSFSYICCKPIAGIKAENGHLSFFFPDGTRFLKKIAGTGFIQREMDGFADRFEFGAPTSFADQQMNGLFGYMAYDAVRYFEDIEINAEKNEAKAIPDLFYQMYQYVIAIDHFKDEAYIFEYSCGDTENGIGLLEGYINSKNIAAYGFRSDGGETSNFSDIDFRAVVAKGKEHCRRGDVFQIVLSREFSQGFSGDDFNVYRALRSVNPSPYLFYFDYGSFKLFGSSPEAQLVVKANTAVIHPIAGTFRRSGTATADHELAEKLRTDKKENAEHVMLVDLARNDLSRNCRDVKVERFKEVQYYSHVIHLVSNVSGKLKENGSVLKVIGDTFPAGTLSGAPKHRAMQLIDKYEKGNRSFYGGCIGFLGFDGTFNSAIMIRTFLSKNNRLFYQAGAGVVDASDEQMELQEVNNKLAALKKAVELANNI